MSIKTYINDYIINGKYGLAEKICKKELSKNLYDIDFYVYMSYINKFYYKDYKNNIDILKFIINNCNYNIEDIKLLIIKIIEVGVKKFNDENDVKHLYNIDNVIDFAIKNDNNLNYLYIKNENSETFDSHNFIDLVFLDRYRFFWEKYELYVQKIFFPYYAYNYAKNLINISYKVGVINEYDVDIIILSNLNFIIKHCVSNLYNINDYMEKKEYFSNQYKIQYDKILSDLKFYISVIYGNILRKNIYSKISQKENTNNSYKKSILDMVQQIEHYYDIYKKNLNKY